MEAMLIIFTTLWIKNSATLRWIHSLIKKMIRISVKTTEEKVFIWGDGRCKRKKNIWNFCMKIGVSLRRASTKGQPEFSRNSPRPSLTGTLNNAGAIISNFLGHANGNLKRLSNMWKRNWKWGQAKRQRSNSSLKTKRQITEEPTSSCITRKSWRKGKGEVSSVRNFCMWRSTSTPSKSGERCCWIHSFNFWSIYFFCYQ